MSEVLSEIEAIVVATPGVLALYRTGSAVRNVIGAAAERLRVREEAASRVVVAQKEDRTEVDIAIGIESGSSAVEVAAAVRERVRVLLVDLNQPSPFIRLTVVHVADGRPLA